MDLESGISDLDVDPAIKPQIFPSDSRKSLERSPERPSARQGLYLVRGFNALNIDVGLAPTIYLLELFGRAL